MKIDYVVQLIILGVRTNPDFEIDIDDAFTSLKGSDIYQINQYRGSIFLKHRNYTFRLTKNGFITLHIKNSFAYLLKNLHILVSRFFLLFSSYFTRELDWAYIHIKNLHLTFDIQCSLSFRKLCEKIVNLYSDKYDFYIMQTNRDAVGYMPVYESLFTCDLNSFGYFRIHCKDTKTIFSFSHNYSGTCLTKSMTQFLEICQDIKMSYCV